MVAALELRRAGYRVQVLEYNNRAGGRCWSLRGGDSYTELGGATQRCEFDSGLYFNPGPARLPRRTDLGSSHSEGNPRSRGTTAASPAWARPRPAHAPDRPGREFVVVSRRSTREGTSGER